MYFVHFLQQGGHWARYTDNFPKVPVRDMVIRERETDRVVAPNPLEVAMLTYYLKKCYCFGDRSKNRAFLSIFFWRSGEIFIFLFMPMEC